MDSSTVLVNETLLVFNLHVVFDLSQRFVAIPTSQSCGSFFDSQLIDLCLEFGVQRLGSEDKLFVARQRIFAVGLLTKPSAGHSATLFDGAAAGVHLETETLDRRSGVDPVDAALLC